MAYRYNNYSLVADSSFDPFLSLQEKLIPFTMYKEAVDKRNTELRDYAKEMSDFAFLDSRLKDNPNSQAAQLYKGFKDRFNAYSADFSKNGLHPGNTGVWMDLFRNYDPIVGQLKRAEKMRETIFNKRLNEKDNTMIYANDNPDIDDFIGGNTPNLYGISGNALYTKGAELAKAISDREVHSGDAGSVLGNYYRNWKETKGIPNPDITEFINQPYVQEELKKVMQSEGLDNLTEEKRARAEQYLLSGFAAGINYEEKNDIQRNLGKLTAAEEADDRRADLSMKLGAKESNYKLDESKKDWVFDSQAAQDKFDIWKKNVPEGSEMVPDSKGNPTFRRKSTTKDNPENLKADDLMPDIMYDEEGNAYDAKTTSEDGFYRGVPISYATAVEEFPEAQFPTEDMKQYYIYYRYTREGKKFIRILRNPAALKAANQEPDPNGTQNPDNQTLDT